MVGRPVRARLERTSTGVDVVTVKLRFHLGRLAGGDFWPMLKLSMAPEMADALHAALGDALDDARRKGVLDNQPATSVGNRSNAAPSAKTENGYGCGKT